MIRLFKSGKHNGLDFSDAQISEIADCTIAIGGDKIPFVLGHPHNDLPVLGYLPRTAIKLYDDDNKKAIGFERADAEFSEPSIDMLKQLGQNKISVRLRGGAISHIGLVKNAAVAENNEQDFAALSGTFYTDADFEEKAVDTITTKVKNLFKSKKMDEQTQAQRSELDEIKSSLDKLSKNLDTVTEMLTGDKATGSVDFSTDDFSHLDETQRKKAMDLCTGMAPAAQSTLVELLKQSARPVVIKGSVVDFAAEAAINPKSARDIIAAQVNLCKTI